MSLRKRNSMVFLYLLRSGGMRGRHFCAIEEEEINDFFVPFEIRRYEEGDIFLMSLRKRKSMVFCIF